ncbi:mannitol-1-phosphate 5-dehydrogenase [Faecalicoccus pleomorphus]|nr:mannitol-1-phosphate 5-dehydrogenase [Faecalicoccus pleomorphus]MBM6677913.1 mannitol-1-phosphate 5-dehydrogenase [Faecalicoccus pleomorphus]MDB7985024.1 mannitol-1-phosphate 5-dehydrogenase [Faecalicoccus pleomorphus]
MKKAIIFGAGKIAKGFIGQLLYLSNFEICFVDVYKPMVDLLNALKKYHVHVLGNSKLDSEVTGFQAFTFDQNKDIYKAFKEADVAFVSVGGNNLPSVGKNLAEILNVFGVPKRNLNIVACENWKDAGKVLKQSILEHLTKENTDLFETYIGVTEAVMMRTATQPDEKLAKEHPEDVWVQNYWYLPIDKSRIKGDFPNIQSVELMDNFGNFLLQKMYTNNTSNAVIAYTGYLLGYEMIAQAANSPEISKILDTTYDEINAILEAELHVDPQQQKDFSIKARAKYMDWTIVDKVIRHAKDPIRKLGPDDRLIGPCRMGIRHGIYPKTIIETIAKALYFDEITDESAQKLKKMRKEKGIPYVLEHVCQLDSEEPLYNCVLKAVEKIQKEGLTKNHE